MDASNGSFQFKIAADCVEMTTIKDVAIRAGVSHGTVSNLISGTHFVNPDTAARIRDAMRDLGYRPNALARSLRRQRSSTIGLVVPDNSNPYFAEVAWHVEKAGVSAGLGTMLCNTGNDPHVEAVSMELLLEKRVDGIIVVSMEGDPATLELMTTAGIPLVLLAREVPGVSADVVVVDNYHGGSLAGRHLVELGHRRMAYVGRGTALSTSVGRLQGFRAALAEAGIPLGSEQVVSAYSHVEDGYRATAALLDRDPDITAVFAYNDIVALGAIRAAQDRKRHVPEMLSVVGFDDISLAGYSSPRLTTIRQPLAELGSLAVSLVVQRLADRDRPPQTCVLPVSLVLRESTAPAPSGVRFSGHPIGSRERLVHPDGAS